MPSRSASNGRDTRSGSCERPECSTLSRQAQLSGCNREPVPPTIMQSAWPRSMTCIPSEIAIKLEASASTMVLLGPRASCAIATWQAGMLGRYLSIHSGYNSLTACSSQRPKSNSPLTMQCRKALTTSSGSAWIMSEPNTAPTRSGGISWVESRACCAAICAAANAIWMLRDITFRLLRGVTYCLGSKSLTAAPTRTGKSGESNSGNRRTPLEAVASDCHTASQPMPIGQTTPAPVITMSRDDEIMGSTIGEVVGNVKPADAAARTPTADAQSRKTLGKRGNRSIAPATRLPRPAPRGRQPAGQPPVQTQLSRGTEVRQAISYRVRDAPASTPPLPDPQPLVQPAVLSAEIVEIRPISR